jgi:hypothetical protein
MKFTTTDQAAQLHGVKTLVHGRAGAGKTTLCATAPQPVIISAEAGLLALRGHKIPVIEVTSMADLYEAYNWARSSQEAKQFYTVCLDSISEIGEVVLTTEKAASKDPRRAYGEMADKMSQLIRGFRDLPEKHVYFSAKQTANKDEISGVTRYGPDMPGRQIGPSLPYFFDLVMVLDVGKDAEGKEFRYLRTRTDLQFEAKDRSGALDEYEAPHLGHVFNKILAGN